MFVVIILASYFFYKDRKEINHHGGFMVFVIEYTGLCGPQRESR